MKNCPVCGIPMIRGGNRPETRSRDHIVPVVLGGNGDRSNIRYMCKRCNHLRGLADHCLGLLACAQTVAVNTEGCPDYRGVLDLLWEWSVMGWRDLLDWPAPEPVNSRVHLVQNLPHYSFECPACGLGFGMNREYDQILAGYKRHWWCVHQIGFNWSA